MPATVALKPEQLKNYLNIAYKQRERASKQFALQYGANSAPVLEVSNELAEINRAIADLNGQIANPTKTR